MKMLPLLGDTILEGTAKAVSFEEVAPDLLDDSTLALVFQLRDKEIISKSEARGLVPLAHPAARWQPAALHHR